MTETMHTYQIGQTVITPAGPGKVTAIDGDEITVHVNGHTKNIPKGLRRPASRTRFHASQLTELPDWHTGDRFRSSGIGTGTILRLGTDHVYVKRDDGREQWLPLTLLSPLEEEDTMNNRPFDNRNPIDPAAFANSGAGESDDQPKHRSPAEVGRHIAKAVDVLQEGGVELHPPEMEDDDGSGSRRHINVHPYRGATNVAHHEPDGTCPHMVENQRSVPPGGDWLEHATDVAPDDPAADPYPVNMGASPDDDRDDSASLEERIDHWLRATVTKAHKKPYAGQLDDIREGVTRLGDLLMSRALGEEDDEPEEAPYHEMADKIIALQHSVEEFKAERDLLIRERNRLREESKALGAALDRIDELEAENATPSAVPEEAATTIKSFSQVWDISPDHLISRADEEIQINLANGWHVVHEQIIVDKNGTTRRYVRFEREVPTTPDTPEDSERAGDFDEVEGAEYVEDWAGMVREPDAIIGIDEPEPNGAKELTFHSPPSTGETPGETQRSIFGAALNMKHLTADEITRAGDLEAQAIASLTYTNEQRRLQHVGPALAALDERLKRNAR